MGYRTDRKEEGVGSGITRLDHPDGRWGCVVGVTHLIEIIRTLLRFRGTVPRQSLIIWLSYVVGRHQVTTFAPDAVVRRFGIVPVAEYPRMHPREVAVVQGSHDDARRARPPRVGEQGLSVELGVIELRDVVAGFLVQAHP